MGKALPGGGGGGREAEEQVIIRGNCISGGAETYKVKGAFGSQQEDYLTKAEGAGSRRGGSSFQRGDIAPLGTFGNVWSYFWLSQLGAEA